MFVGALILGLVVCVGVWVALFKLTFDDRDGFFECVMYCFKPDLWSWIQGDGLEDFWCTLNLNCWLAVGFAAGAGTFLGVVSLFG